MLSAATTSARRSLSEIYEHHKCTIPSLTAILSGDASAHLCERNSARSFSRMLRSSAFGPLMGTFIVLASRLSRDICSAIDRDADIRGME